MEFISLYRFLFGKELDYISKVEHRISDILLNSNTDSSISIKMDELIDRYPMEVVVEKNNDVVYNSVPVLGSINMIGKLNQEALPIESQGTYNGYNLWFALYHVPNATYMAPFMKKQGVIIALALLVLSFVVILTRRGFKDPLKQLKTSLASIKEYDFDNIQDGHDDINIQMIQ